MLLVVLASLSSLTLVPQAAASGLPPKATHTLQYGMDTDFDYNCQAPSVILADAQTQFSMFKALGANAVGISFPLYTNAINSNDVYTSLVCNKGFESPPVAILSDVVQVAHSLGLKVMLRPLINETILQESSKKAWRGILKPSNIGEWFTSYLHAIAPYIRMAQADGVEHFAIETELDSLSLQKEWATVIALTKNIYTGDIVWNYTWSSGVKKILRPYTSLGIDAYPQLRDSPPTATVRQLLLGWNSELRQEHSIPKPSIATFDEIGISAQDGAYAHPSVADLPLRQYPFDEKIQVNWVDTACTFMRQHKMHGMYFWGSWLTSAQGELLSAPNPSNPSEIQPLALDAIKNCFSAS